MHELFRYTPRWVVAPLLGVVWLAVALGVVAGIRAAGGSPLAALAVVAVAYVVRRVRSYPKYETGRPAVVFEPVQSVWLSVLLLAAGVAFIGTLVGGAGLWSDLATLSAVVTLVLVWLIQDIVVRRNTYRFPLADGWRAFAWDAALRLSFLPLIYVLATGDQTSAVAAERLAVLLPFATTSAYVLLARFRTAAYRQGSHSVGTIVDGLLPQPRWWPEGDDDPDPTDTDTGSGSGPPSNGSPNPGEDLEAESDAPVLDSTHSEAVRYQQSGGSEESETGGERFRRAVRAVEVTSSTCSLVGMLFGAVQFLV